jgi:FAD/FMN-containing dehydrogenase
MVASNAAGARSLRYGATRPWVRAVHAVFDDGSCAWIRRGDPLPLQIPAVARLVAALQQTAAMDATQLPPGLLTRDGVLKESSGYAVAATLAPGGHLVDLLVGSEGTLALFTAVELVLCPVPGATGTVLATFPTLEAATACAMTARTLGVSACELLDRTLLDVAATDGPTGIDARAEAVLLIEVEGDNGALVTDQLTEVSTQCLAAGAESVATGLDAETQHRLWALRHAASPILARLAPRLRSMQFIEDGCVPPAHFPAYVRGVRAALARAGITGVIFGHAGDAHAHVNPLVDVTLPDWRDRVIQLWTEVAELTGRLGGTLAGEHGDGRLRAPWLPRSWPVGARAVFAHIKAAADPTGVFNAGCKVAPETTPLLPSALRHDPEADPLDPRARAFLDQIEQTRRWQTFRLDGAPDGTPAP